VLPQNKAQRKSIRIAIGMFIILQLMRRLNSTEKIQSGVSLAVSRQTPQVRAESIGGMPIPTRVFNSISILTRRTIQNTLLPYIQTAIQKCSTKWINRF